MLSWERDRLSGRIGNGLIASHHQRLDDLASLFLPWRITGRFGLRCRSRKPRGALPKWSGQERRLLAELK
jgi:hypothetical protein